MSIVIIGVARNLEWDYRSTACIGPEQYSHKVSCKPRENGREETDSESNSMVCFEEDEAGINEWENVSKGKKV